ncbi:MAG: T9SS type A sorting domain-containing protein [Bacteroidota bacterium]
MRKYIYLLSLSIVLLSMPVSGKAQTIGMSKVGPINYSDTVTAGAVDSFTVWVKNVSTTVFNDTLTLVGAVRDDVNPAILNYVGSYSSFSPVLINANDSVSIPVLEVYTLDTNNYRPGINVIVIWPVAQSAATADSLEFTVYIIDANGMNDLDLKQFIKTFPNPSTDNITIENISKINIEEVRIYDMTGRLLETIKNRSVIDTEKWTVGMYLLDIWLENNQKHSVRIIKQK